MDPAGARIHQEDARIHPAAAEIHLGETRDNHWYTGADGSELRNGSQSTESTRAGREIGAW